MFDKLQAKVRAVNRANKEAIDLYNILVPIIAPFVGEKVELKGGGLTAKVKTLLPDFPCTPQLHIHRHISNYSLAWTVKTGELVGTYGWIFHEVTVYVGDLKDGVLTKIIIPSNRRTDYTEEEVKKNREKLNNVEKAMRAAQSALYPFGEYDT